MKTAPRRRPATALFAPTLLVAALAAAGLTACGGGGGDSSPALSAADQQAQDVSKAKTMFASLRSNARALQTDATGTGIADGVKTFGTSTQTDAVPLAAAVTDSIRLDQLAFALWDDYKAGRTTANTRNDNAILSGCTVFQGAFPTSLGPASTTGTDFVSSSVAASNAANATWVACSKNSIAQPAAGIRRYRQTVLYDTAGAVAAGTYPASVAYKAITRSQYVDASGTAFLRNLTPTFAGVVGFPAAGGTAGGFLLKGDLPPLTDAAGRLLADHYAADVDGTVSAHASGGRQIAFASGVFSEWAGSPAAVRYSVNLGSTAAGTTTVVVPSDNTVAAQRAAAQMNLYATVTGPSGSMDGSFVADQFDLAADGSLLPRHAKFTGNVSVLPAGGTAPVSFLSGTLELTQPQALRSVAFNGQMTLPGRPQATLTATVAETSATSRDIQGSYTQNGLTIAFAGTSSSAATSVVFSDSSGVKATVASNAGDVTITVDGRPAGRIDKATLTIVYADGTTESLQ